MSLGPKTGWIALVEITKLSFVQQLKSYPKQFWVANTMEIFERLSWYGWFTVMALYVTGSVETGGLGFTTETRGALMAIVPFFLYLLPVLTGAMADRYGYKKSFITAFLVMIVSYYLLGQFTSLPSFFMAFMFVAVGAGIFKPVVTGTVAKVTDESNSALAFGIFYMMVNIGGAVGPIVAGLVRGWGWEWVFVASSAWAGVNLIIVLTLYEEPPRDEAQKKGTLKQVVDNMVDVLGNFRFFLTVFVVLFTLMFANLRVWIFEPFTWEHAGYVIAGWLALNFLWDRLLPAGSGDRKNDRGKSRNPFMRRMFCSNWRFALFLLIMSGFWTAFVQIFYTMPEYIRDFTETKSIVDIFGKRDPTDPNKGAASKVATINPKEKAKIIGRVQPLWEVMSHSKADAPKILTAWSEIFAAANAIAEDKAIEPQAKSKKVLEITLATYQKAGLPEPKIDSRVAEAYGKAELEVPATGEAIANLALELLHVPGPAWKTDRAKQLIDKLKDLEVVGKLDEAQSQALRQAAVGTAFALLDAKVRILPEELARAAGADPDLLKTSNQVVINYRQFNPEFLINLNAVAIILFQVMVSFVMARFHQFTTMIIGMVVAAVGIGLPALAGTGGVVGIGVTALIVSASLLIFSFGEMMASPTSQEYVGRIAPSDKKALYMGYYFVAIALGNLFGGILSGELYGKFARDMQRPDIMWMIFGGLMMFTAIVFLIYNKYALPKEGAASMMGEAAEDGASS